MPTSASAKGRDTMTDKAIEAAAEALADKWNEVYGGESSAEYFMEFARAAIAAYEQAMWRPIEEAKKDGTLVDLFLPYGIGRITSCFWREDGDCGPNWYRTVIEDDQPFDFAVGCAPTHYRPLPPPPGKEG